MEFWSIVKRFYILDISMNHLIFLLILTSITLFLLLSYTCSLRQLPQLQNEQMELFEDLTQFNNYRTDPSQTLHISDDNS